MAYWSWFIIGLFLIVSELVLPTFVMVWFGGAALALGVVVIFVPDLSVALQIFIFAMLAIASTLLYQVYAKPRKGSDLED